MNELLYPLGDRAESEIAVASHLEGAFTGWSGRTLFKLRNGQLWQQEGFSCLYRYSYMPRVLIGRSGDGYEMLVEGVPTRIPVRRLR